jgi:putative sigma-54 modulation protein
MNLDIQAHGFTLFDKSRAFLEKKLGKIHNAEEIIVDLLIKLNHDKEFTAEATVNFRWGASAHVKETDFELDAAMNKMIDTLEAKINKEKEKAKEKK